LKPAAIFWSVIAKANQLAIFLKVIGDQQGKRWICLHLGILTNTIRYPDPPLARSRSCSFQAYASKANTGILQIAPDGRSLVTMRRLFKKNRFSMRAFMIRFCLCIALCWLVFSPAHAMDLAEAYRRALQHDARFASARAAYAAGREQLPQARARLLPTVTLEAGKTSYDANITYQGATSFQGGDRRYDNKEYGISLTQPLYQRSLFAAYRQSEARVALAEAEYRLAQHDLILRVTQTYLELLAAQDNLELAQRQKSTYQTQYDQSQAKLRAGAGTRIDVSDAHAKLDLAVSQEIAARNEVDVRRQALWKLVGVRVEKLPSLDAQLALKPPVPAEADKWIATAQEKNPRLNALRQALLAAEQEIMVARGAHHPTLDLNAGIANARSTGSVYTSAGSDSNVKSVGVQLKIPLFQGGGASSRVREAAALRDKVREELLDTQREVQVQVRQAHSGIYNGIAQIKALELAQGSSEEALKASRIGLQVGSRNILDVFNAESQLQTVRRDLARARYEYLLNILRLKAAAGTLGESDLKLMDRK